MARRCSFGGVALFVGLTLGGCQGQPHTEWRERPVTQRRAPPPGHAVFAAVLVRVDSQLDGERLPLGSEVARGYVRILRRAAVFTEVLGPSAQVRSGTARLRLRSELEADPRAAGNVGRSLLIALSLTLLRPALPFQLDLDGEMELKVTLPGEERSRPYRARAAASRFYYHASQHRGALEVLMREITTENFRAIVQQLREDPALTAAPAFERTP